MNKKIKNISKLLLAAGFVSLMASAGQTAPLSYDLQQPAVRTDYNAPNKIKIEGSVNFNSGGQKVSLSLRDTDVQQVLRMFADKAGLNIVFHKSAVGLITLDLVDVDLEDAFKMIMKMTNLTYVIKGKTMLVAGISEAESLNLTKDNITVIPVKYADAAYIAHFLNTNIFSLNAPGLSFGPIVSTNADKNELLIFGTDNDVQMAKKIVDKFDKKPVMTTYRVNHTTPFEMAKMVCETLFQLPVSGNMADAGRGVGKFSSALNSNFRMQKNLEKPTIGSIGAGTVACIVTSGVKTENISSFQSKPSLTIYVQPELGTLTMVGGSEQQIQMVNDFIMDNDRKQPQAFLEISIISLTEKGQKDFNSQWAYNGKHLSLSFTGTNGLQTDFPIMWHGPSNGSAVHSLQQTLHYLISNGKARLLANPKIVITNGKTSTIDLTQDYIESTTVQFVSANNGQNAGGNNMYAQKTYEIGEDNGIKIEVTPFISPDGYVSLNIKPDYASVLDDVIDELGGVPYTAATLLQRHNLDLKNVRIRDEETLVLGGMIQTSENTNVAKIPILGDIPVVGFLFRTQQKTLEKNELLFIITPRIIKDTEDIAEL